MKFIVLSSLTIVTVYSITLYITDQVHRSEEINSFFSLSEDKKWADSYSDKTIDFCTLDLPLSKVAGNEGHNTVFSPSLRYQILIPQTSPGMKIVDIKSGETILSLPHGPGFNHTRWALNEKYLIYLDPVEADDDFASPKVYIVNLETRNHMFLANAQTQDCFD